MQSIEEHLNELSRFLQSGLPQSKPKPPTFLQISEMPHYENVISNIYAFFLQPNEVHGFGNMFIEALLNAVSSDIYASEIGVDNVSVKREVTTHKGNRIDLLVSSSDVSLIVENKIYHHDEYNPFEDYWSFVSTAKKLGVVITLQNTKPRHAGFVNLTHRDFMRHVLELLPSRFASAAPKYLIYLHDLVQDIDSLYPMHNSENLAAVKFFLDNREKFAQLERIQNLAERFKLDEIDNVARRLELPFRSTGATGYKYIDLHNGNGIRLSYEVWIGHLFKTRSFMIRLCSTGNTQNLASAYEKVKEKAELKGLVKPEQKKYEDWLYFFEKVYSVEDDNGSNENLLKFADELYKVIVRDWADIANQVLTCLVVKPSDEVLQIASIEETATADEMNIVES